MLEALYEKYTDRSQVPKDAVSNEPLEQPEMITLGSSNGAIQVEAVDLAKVRRKFARLDRLKEVGLEEEDIATLTAPHHLVEGAGAANEDAAAILARTCPSSCILLFSLPTPCAIHPSALLERTTRQSRSGCAEVATPLSGSACPPPAPIFHIFWNVTDSHIFYAPSCAGFLLRADPSLSCWRYTSDGRSPDLTSTCAIFQSVQISVFTLFHQNP